MSVWVHLYLRTSFTSERVFNDEQLILFSNFTNVEMLFKADCLLIIDMILKRK